jgi:hypothetical protein
VSKDNVLLFVKAINAKPEIEERLKLTNRLDDWVEVGIDAGFEFNADEFCAVLEEVFGRCVTRHTAITDFLVIRKQIGTAEMMRTMWKFYIGGVARTFDFFRGDSA